MALMPKILSYLLYLRVQAWNVKIVCNTSELDKKASATTEEIKTAIMVVYIVSLNSIVMYGINTIKKSGVKCLINSYNFQLNYK